MKNTKYLTIFGLVLILGLSMNVSAIPYISIGNMTHNFTVVPNQPADMTLPIMVKNASDAPIKGLQFNVTFNCSMINITNITHVDIVNVSNANRTELYNKLCNGSDIPPGLLQKAFCFFMNTTLAPDNRTNTSILFATVRELGNGSCILRIAFASYKNLTGDVIVGRIRMKVNSMENYFIRNATSPLNITIERMGLNRTLYVDVSDPTNHSRAKIDGLIMACRGDVTKDNKTGVEERMKVIRATLLPGHPNYAPLFGVEKACLELVDHPIQNRMIIIRASLLPGHPNYLNISNIPIEYY